MKPIPTHMLKLMSDADRKSLGKAGKLPEEIASEQEIRTEKAMQETICGMLRRKGIWFARDAMNRRRFGSSGQPDFLGSVKKPYGAIPFALECKLPGKKPTEDQEKCHAEMIKSGWQVKVVFSHIEAFQFIEELENLR